MTKTTRNTLEEVPDFLLEQAVLGELPPDEQRRIEALPGFSEYRRRLEADNQAILSLYSPAGQLEAIRRRSLAAAPAAKPAPTAGRSAWIKFSAAVVPLAAAAAFALVLLSPGRETVLGSDVVGLDTTRVKGASAPAGSESALAASRQARLASLRQAAGLLPPATAAEALNISVRSAKDIIRSLMSEEPRLEIWRQVNGKAEILAPGARVKAFDNLQLAYEPAGRGYGMIVSLDGRGRLTLHYPEAFNARPVLDQGNPVILDFAYQLDDAPRFERFFFITSHDHFEVNAIWSVLEKQFGNSVPTAWAVDAAPLLPAGFDVSSFLLNK
jgi:hypothetical protein